MPAHMLPKPAKGTAAKAREARRAAIEAAERKAKAAAKARDLVCRFPGCHKAYSIEAAHLVDKGMGGDHGRHSATRSDYVTLCAEHHRGPRSLHSGHIRAWSDDRGGDGPVNWWTRGRVEDPWDYAGTT